MSEVRTEGNIPGLLTTRNGALYTRLKVTLSIERQYETTLSSVDRRASTIIRVRVSNPLSGGQWTGSGVAIKVREDIMDDFIGEKIALDRAILMMGVRKNSTVAEAARAVWRNERYQEKQKEPTGYAFPQHHTFTRHVTLPLS